MTTRGPVAAAPAQAERRRGPSRATVARLGAASAPVAIFVLAAWFWGRYAADARGWSVMTDELQYVKLALSIGEEHSLRPQIYGRPQGSFNQLYPVLLAVPYAVFDMVDAFKAAHVLNALVLASTAFPTFLLCRTLGLRRELGWLAAALTVSVPWMLFGTMLLTEVVAYPVFVWAVLAIVRAIGRPSPARDLLALGAILLAFAARTQFILLGLLFPVTVVVADLGWSLVRAAPGALRRSVIRGSLARTARSHVVLTAGFSLLVLVALGLYAIGEIGLFGRLLGSYDDTLRGEMFPPQAGMWAARHVATVAVAVGMLPLSLGLAWALAALTSGRTTREGHAFATFCVVGVPVIVLQVTSFVMRFSGGAVNDRYLFYIAPLMIVAMVAFFGHRRIPWWSVAAGAVALWWLARFPDYRPGNVPGAFNSPAGVFWPVLSGRSDQIGDMLGISSLRDPFVLLPWAGALATVAAAVLARRTRGLLAATVVGGALLAFSVAETRYVFNHASGAQAGRPAESAEHADWVDRLVPEGTTVAALHSPTAGDVWLAHTIWWDLELYNRSIRQLYRFGYGERAYSNHTPFKARAFDLDLDDGHVEVMPPEAPYIVWAHADPSLRFGLYGESIARTGSGLELLKPDRPYRTHWYALIGDTDGYIPGFARIRVLGRPSGPAREQNVRFLYSAPFPVKRRFRWQLTAGAQVQQGTIGTDESRRLTARVCVAPGASADVDLVVRGRHRLDPGLVPYVRDEVGGRITGIEVTEGGPCTP